jgi:hypothetical protein
MPLRRVVEVKFAFKNYGKTPATLKEVRGILERLTGPPPTLDAHAPYLELPAEITVEHGLLSGEFKLGTSQFFTLAEAINVNNGEMAIWLRGHVIYDDVFGREGTQQFIYKIKTMGGFVRFYERHTYRNTRERTGL